MIPLPAHNPGPSVTEGFQLEEREGGRWGVALLVAIAAHTLGALYVGALPPPQAPPLPPVQVELAFREPPPPAPLPEPVLPEPEPKVAAVKPMARPKAEAPAPPAAAKAGAVLTAAPDAPEPEPSAEPFDFTSDPSSTVYGAGVVAASGTALVGARGAQVGGRGSAPVAAPAGDGLTAASDLSERPRLRDSDPCRGYFPKSATSDAAVATVRVVIGKRGKVTSASVVSEAPSGQGFGSAARTCMLEQVFSPGLDRAGQPAATSLNVNVKFSR